MNVDDISKFRYYDLLIRVYSDLLRRFEAENSEKDRVKKKILGSPDLYSGDPRVAGSAMAIREKGLMGEQPVDVYWRLTLEGN